MILATNRLYYIRLLRRCITIIRRLGDERNNQSDNNMFKTFPRCFAFPAYIIPGSLAYTDSYKFVAT